MFPVMSAGNPITGYNINNSLRFRSSASAYLSRTPATASNRTTWTWSGWIKRGALGIDGTFFDAANNDQFRWRSDDTFSFSFNNTLAIQTTQVFRDPSAWYHFVVVADTTQATAANRIKLYVNGVQVTAFSTASYPAQNTTGFINSANAHNIGRVNSGTYYLDGYLAEVNFVDGQALTPSSFGETDTTTGSWKPKAYTGTYGTNGFYLKFADASAATAAAIGKDSSGNGNNWTPSGISVTAGTTYDAMLDSPTLTSTTVANYSTWNRALYYNSGYVLSDGNLSTAYSSGTGAGLKTYSSIGITSGKWYWEYKFTASNPNFYVGWRTADDALYFGVGCSSGNLNTETSSGSFSGSTVTVANGDVLGIAFDYDSGACYFYKNNTLFYTLTGFTTSSSTLFASTGIWSGGGGAASGSSTFGQRPFSYTPPTGYLSLNTYNLPTPTIKAGNKYMDATTYTGTGAALNVTNTAGFKPDFVWVKDRGAAQQHLIYDSIRGVYNFIGSSSTAAESTNNQTLTSFNSNGFGLGTNGTSNSSAGSFVGWQWQAGQGSSSSNTNGSITSTVSVNTTAGFSIVTYTGNNGVSQTVGHGLGVAPKMVITKGRTNAFGWGVQHIGLTGGNNYLALNSTAAQATDNTQGTITNATSTTFQVSGSGGSSSWTNVTGVTYVSYVWAEIVGFSKFGSYTGNGSTDGTFVYLGFRPKFVMVKISSAATDGWVILDSSRNTYNVNDKALAAESSGAEFTVAFSDFTSNGFKVRTTNSAYNTNAATYIYMAFAESPFKSSLAR